MSFFDQTIQINNSNSSVASTSTTGSITTTNVSEMLLLCTDYSSTTAISTPPTIAGSNMTFVKGGTAGSHRQEVWSYLTSAQLSAAPVVVTFPSSVNSTTMLTAFNGVSAVAASVIQAYAGSGAGSGTVNVPITTADAYDYVVAFFAAQIANSPSAGTGFTGISASASSQDVVAGIYANAATATPGSTNAAWNYSPGINAGNFFALALRSGPTMASAAFSGTTGTLTWASLPGGVLQASGFGTTQGLTGTASGGAFTISGVTTTGLTTTFTTSRTLGAGETGTVSVAAGAFTDNSATSNPCPAGTVAFTIAGTSTAPRNLTVTLVY